MTCALLDERKKVQTAVLSSINNGTEETGSLDIYARVDIPSSILNFSLAVGFRYRDKDTSQGFAVPTVEITPFITTERNEEIFLAVTHTGESIPFSFELIGGTMADGYQIKLSIAAEALGNAVSGTFEAVGKWEINPDVVISKELAREILDRCSITKEGGIEVPATYNDV